MDAKTGMSLLSVPSVAQSRKQLGLSAPKGTSRLPRHPGYSLFEWKKLCESGEDLSGTDGQLLHISTEDLAQHNTEDDCWTAIRGKVYNVTRFLKYHPGRKAQLLRGAGTDCTALFDKLHSWVNEEAILKHCLVGILKPGKSEATFHQCTVTAIESVTYDTKLYTLCEPSHTPLHISPGQHIKMQAEVSGEVVEREYTPVVPLVSSGPSLSQNDLLLMIKIYPHGRMTQYLATVKVGDSLFISGPAGSFSVSKLHSARDVVLIAGGSGLTPMVRLLNERLIVQKKKEDWSTTLLFANKNERDILWREQLEQLSPRFRVVHILSSPSEEWVGERGRITTAFLKRHLPQSSHDEMLICVSGPVPFAGAVANFLFNMKYPDDIIHCFD